VTEIAEQLQLFIPVEANGHARTNAELGLRGGIPPGAERLLGELVRRGLRSSELTAAASLCLALDEGTDRR
jgi:hypothetical protein